MYVNIVQTPNVYGERCIFVLVLISFLSVSYSLVRWLCTYVTQHDGWFINWWKLHHIDPTEINPNNQMDSASLFDFDAICCVCVCACEGEGDCVCACEWHSHFNSCGDNKCTLFKSLNFFVALHFQQFHRWHKPCMHFNVFAGYSHTLFHHAFAIAFIALNVKWIEYGLYAAFYCIFRIALKNKNEKCIGTVRQWVQSVERANLFVSPVERACVWISE